MAKPKQEGVQPQGVGVVPMPSADLIVYRFDQTDKKIDDLSKQFEIITQNFLSKDEARVLKEEHDNDIRTVNKRIDDNKKIFDNYLEEQNNEKKEKASNNKWTRRLFIASIVSLIFTIAGGITIAYVTYEINSHSITTVKRSS